MNLHQLKSSADALLPKLIEYRRWLHQYPELSFQEFDTSKYIAQQLRAIGITDIENVAGTGLVAMIYGNQPGKCIALRADMDALPIQEKNNVAYQSKNAGVMHACGHDVHTTCLLGAAELLFQQKSSLSGSFKLIFQPGEEQSPGGASLMIAAGVLQNPKVDAMIGLHTAPELQVGTLGYRSGMYMASSDEVHITIEGKGGHAALPHRCIDPIPIAAQIIVALQTIVSRRANATIPTVLSFGQIIGGTANNIIASEVKLHGTFRTFDEAWRADAKQLICKIVTDIATANGATATVEMPPGYPVLENNSGTTNIVKNMATEMMGANKIKDLSLRMTSEDFAAFAQEVPACFFRLGTDSVDNKFSTAAHTDTFDVDESCLSIGAAAMASGAIALAEFK